MKIQGVYEVYEVEHGEPFASGGNAELFRCVSGNLVYKRYKKQVRSRAAVTQLFEVMRMGRQVLVVDEKQPGSTPEASVNWPIDLVPAGNDVQGVIIPMIPARFFHDGQPCDLSHLSLARSEPPAATVRVPVLIRFAEIMAWLDQHELVHGDISYKNVVWSKDPPGAYLIDTDGLQRRGQPTQSAATPQWVDPRRSTRLIAHHDHYSDWYALGLAMYRGLFLNPGSLDQRGDGTWRQPSSLPDRLDPAIRGLIQSTLSNPLQTDGRARPRAWVETLIRVYVSENRFDEARLRILDDYAEQYREAERRKAEAARTQTYRRIPTPTAPSQARRPQHAPTPTPAPANRAPYVRPPAPPQPRRPWWTTYRPRRWGWRARLVAVAAFLLVSSVISEASTPSGGSGAQGGRRRSTESGDTSVNTTTYQPTSGDETSSGGNSSRAGSGRGRANKWIAQLGSVPIASGRQALHRMENSIQGAVPDAEILVSSNFASLKPGYWVIYDPGPFRNGAAALRFCASRGRTNRNACIGRYLSHARSDRDLQCFPPAWKRSDGCFL